jgi:hypothetical protein
MGQGDRLRWSLRECQFKPGDNDECLREDHEDVSRSLNLHVNAVWSRVVDVVLQHTSVRYGDGNEEKADEDSGGEIEVNL